MPWQLIYTSTPRGLVSGQSGFCTVARSADLREALVQRLEQISSYHYLRVSAVGKVGGNPTISAFRIMDIRGAKYQVLTRIEPCGLDFTGRTNHLAHHLIFQPGELAQLPSPAAILRDWTGWSNIWRGEPRLLADAPLDEFGAIKRPTFPANAWLQMTGDAGRAAGLLDSDCLAGVYLICPAGGEQQLLSMFAETLQLLDHTGQYPLRPWRHSFTNFMQAEDNPLDFQWRGCQEGSPAYLQAVQRSAPMLPLRSVRVPANSLSKIARDSQRPPAASGGATPSGAAPLTRGESGGSTRPAAPRFDSLKVQPVSGSGAGSHFLNMNLWVDSATLARLGIFLGVILALFATKIWLGRRQAATTVIVPAAIEAFHPTRAQAASPNTVTETPSAAMMDLKGLDALWAEGPTYFVLTSNLSSFPLSIQKNSPFQNMIHRCDSLNLLTSQIRLLVSTDHWDVTSDAPLAVSGRKGELSAGPDGSAQCVFDYSDWLARSGAPVWVRTSFGVAPSAISARFTFLDTNDGDPFRVLAINPSNPPPPLILDRSGVQAGSLNPAVAQRLSQIHLMDGESWRLRPYLNTRDGTPSRYLYEDWPADETPAAGEELDFAGVRKRLSSKLGLLQTNATGLEQKLAKWPKAGFDLPLGEALRSTNKELASFADFARGNYSAPRFVEYVRHLRSDRAQALGLPGWPNTWDDAEPSELADEFQRLHAILTEKFPGSARDLTLDNTNYFYAMWRNLRRMGGTRQEAAQAADEARKEQARLDSVPTGLNGTAYVGLFIVGKHEADPRVEMIRFR
jgi:hypothetical protein